MPLSGLRFVRGSSAIRGLAITSSDNLVSHLKVMLPGSEGITLGEKGVECHKCRFVLMDWLVGA